MILELLNISGIEDISTNKNRGQNFVMYSHEDKQDDDNS